MVHSLQPQLMDPPLVLTQHHDPNVIFRAQFSFNQPESSQSPTILCANDDLWSKYYRMSNSYRELYTQNRELSEGHQALKEEYNTLRDTYLRLRCKHQELVDDAMHSRIESWRHAVRLEEVKNELCLLKQNEALPQYALSPTSLSSFIVINALPGLQIFQTQAL